jgi:hypothetical protein
MIEASETITMKEERKSVNLRKETWERLQSFGRFRESTDELLNRMMDDLEKTATKASKK